MCLYPNLIKNRKYLPNKKNGGHPPPITDERTKYVPIGCQNCIECRKQKAREWQVRLLEDIKANKNAKFITLTFSNESYSELSKEIEDLDGYTRDNAIATLAVRRFLERWRKHYQKSLRHWLITELGHAGTENIHIHGLIWTDEQPEVVSKHWRYGYTWQGTFVNGTTISYICKYVHKMDKDHETYKPRILTSAGIGKNYMERTDWKRNIFKGKVTKETYKTPTGHEIALPIYWRNKIYTEQQREQLWLQRLDRNERWIMGEKIDVSKSHDRYYKLLRYYQDKNIKLGYGDDTNDWQKKEYERQRRNLLNKQRIKENPPTCSPLHSSGEATNITYINGNPYYITEWGLRAAG